MRLATTFMQKNQQSPYVQMLALTDGQDDFYISPPPTHTHPKNTLFAGGYNTMKHCRGRKHVHKVSLSCLLSEYLQ